MFLTECSWRRKRAYGKLGVFTDWLVSTECSLQTDTVLGVAIV